MGTQTATMAVIDRLSNTESGYGTPKVDSWVKHLYQKYILKLICDPIVFHCHSVLIGFYGWW